MSVSRARVAQSLRNGLRQSCARPSVKSNTFRQAQLQAKRFASSGGHQKSSDLPWIIAAGTITPASCYYLWPTASDHHGEHGHDEKHEEHEEKHESEEKPAEEEPAEEKPAEEKPAEEKEEASDDKSEEKSDDAAEKKDDDDDEEEKDAAKSTSTEKRGQSKVDGVNFKGKVKDDSEGAEHSAKSEDDNKGANKKRLDSGLAKNLGPASQEGKRDSTTQEGKQAGQSNTQTRHSIPIHESSEQSKKPDGTPETAKSVGTVE